MPIVPFAPSPRASTPKLPKVDDPWLLMAAATMDAQGRLVHPNIEDRREQGLKERDNEMVNDQQLPRTNYGDMDADTFGKLNRALGTSELDAAERDNIVKAVERALAARGKR